MDDQNPSPDAAPPAGPEIFAFQQRGLRRLLAWGLFSMALGLAQQRASRPGSAAFGRHFAGWGLVDALLALGGLALSSALQHGLLSRRARSDTQRWVRYTGLILKSSVGLDLLLLLAGLLALRRAGPDDERHAAGRAMVAQACFLTVFDALHASLLGPDGGDRSRSASGVRFPADKRAIMGSR